MASLLGQLSYRIQDSSGVFANKVIYFVFPDTATLANVQSFAAAYALLLDAVTEGQIVKQTFRVTLATSGLKSAPLSDSDVQETGLINFVLSTSFYSYGDDIPAVIDAAVPAGRFDPTQADINAYIGFMTSAHSGFVPSNEFEADLAAVNFGMETFRKKRKQLNAASRQRVAP